MACRPAPWCGQRTFRFCCLRRGRRARQFAGANESPAWAVSPGEPNSTLSEYALGASGVKVEPGLGVCAPCMGALRSRAHTISARKNRTHYAQFVRPMREGDVVIMMIATGRL